MLVKKNQKKKWVRPKLAILLRAPGENILLGCKSGMPEEPAALQPCIFWASNCPGGDRIGCVDVTAVDPKWPWAHVPCSGSYSYEVCPSRAIAPS